MRFKVIVHEAEEGGFWAEVPAIPGCATQGDTFEELLHNLYEAVDGCFPAGVEGLELPERWKSAELAVQESIDKAWAEEIERRVKELESGAVQATPGEEFDRELRSRFRK